MERIQPVWPKDTGVPAGTRTGPPVRLTNPDKVLYPATGTTKADVFRYYTSIAPVMVPHLAGRPVTRKRWPNGVENPSFFEKNLAASAPAWLSRRRIEHKTHANTYPIADSSAALAWMAQQAALELHVPQWRFAGEARGPANRLVFDLDPGEGVGLPQIAVIARAIRELLDGIGLTTYPVTSGSKGIHLYVPLDRPVSSAGAVAVAKKVASQLEQQDPETVTATMSRRLRAGKVFVDWSQNNANKTTVSPYSLRGREQPNVAAPRTWDELEDPDLRQLRFDEVLERVSRDGDLIEALDRPPAANDRLTTYRSMRDPDRTPEPVPRGHFAAEAETLPRFVIQEHHATRLHYDFRLEREGVLVSWAVPKNLPTDSSANHLAVHTEDHPLEYATFEGTIPKGQYGAGTVSIWDSGTYETEKFVDPTGPRAADADAADRKGEVIVVLHGERVTGRYALIQTNGNQWLAHRMKDQPAPMRSDVVPMLPTAGSIAGLDARDWAFEGKWDGYRLILECDRGRWHARSRSGRDVTSEFGSLAAVAHQLADHRVILDGEAVVLDDDSQPSFALLQDRSSLTRVRFWAFDVLYLDGKSLLRNAYRDRRRVLEALAESTDAMDVPARLDSVDGTTALTESRKRGWEGVVAKRLDSTYSPGRTRSWIKDKNWDSEEVVIGGWRVGRRSSGIASLLMGIPVEGGLQYVGRVGTGFTERELARLKTALEPLRASRSPFIEPLSGPDAKDVQFVKPVLVGEIRYGEATAAGIRRHSSWRGLRPDKSVDDLRTGPSSG